MKHDRRIQKKVANIFAHNEWQRREAEMFEAIGNKTNTREFRNFPVNELSRHMDKRSSTQIRPNGHISQCLKAIYETRSNRGVPLQKTFFFSLFHRM